MTARLTKALALPLERTAAKTGVSQGQRFAHHRLVKVGRQDFRVYRRNKREVIPLLCPPEG